MFFITQNIFHTTSFEVSRKKSPFHGGYRGLISNYVSKSGDRFTLKSNFSEIIIYSKGYSIILLSPNIITHDIARPSAASKRIATNPRIKIIRGFVAILILDCCQRQHPILYLLKICIKSRSPEGATLRAGSL